MKIIYLQISQTTQWINKQSTKKTKTKQHEIKWNGNKAMKKNDDNHAGAVTQSTKKKNTKQHETKWNGNKAMKKNDDNHARAVTFPVRIADVRCRSNCTITVRVGWVWFSFFKLGFLKKLSFQKVYNEKVFFQKTECLIKVVKKCIMKKCFLKKLNIWLALIKVTVWGINYQKDQCIYKGVYFILKSILLLGSKYLGTNVLEL